MAKYIIKRLLLALFILFGVSIILYVLVRLMPVNIIRDRYYATHGQAPSDEAELAAILAVYHLEDLNGMSFWQAVQSLCSGWWTWISNFVRGDFGRSLANNQEVSDMIFSNMGVSFAVSFISLIFELIIAIPLGIKCACNQYGKLDYAATVLTMIGISFPSFFFGSLCIKLFGQNMGGLNLLPISGLHTNSLPPSTSGWIKFWDMVQHLILPIFVLTVLSIGSMMRYTRTNTLEVLNADYIRTARAKGLSENKVVYKHVFRNTLIPLITTLAGVLPTLFGGAIITEQIFNLPGIGNTAYKALSTGDVPMIMAYNMFIAVLTVIGILLSDIMYVIVDPRVKLGK